MMMTMLVLQTVETTSDKADKVTYLRPESEITVHVGVMRGGNREGRGGDKNSAHVLRQDRHTCDSSMTSTYPTPQSIERDKQGPCS